MDTQLRPVSSGYTGAPQQDSFFGHVSSGSFFCAIEVFDGYTKEAGDDFLSALTSVISSRNPHSLKEFEDGIVDFVKNATIPIDFSLAAGYVAGSVFYLKTMGTGQIYLRRGTHFEELIEGDTSASGYIKEKDLFCLSTSFFMNTTKRRDLVKKAVHTSSAPEAVSAYLAEHHQGENEGGVCLFVQFVHHAPVEPATPAAVVPEPPPLFATPQALEKPKNTKSILTNIAPFVEKLKGNPKKKVVFAITAIVLVALLLNSGNLFGQKKLVLNESKIDVLSSQIDEDLSSIDTNGDMSNALGIISASRQRINEYRAKDKNAPSDSLKDLEDRVSQKEAQVLKREEKSAAEFHDLAVEEKGAQADRMYLDGDTVALLNRTGKVYLLSLQNKSIEKRVFGEIANAQLVSLYDDSVFFYKQGAGIYKIKGEGKPEKIISNDKEWGNVADMNIYNGNIYLLDEEKNNVYKYLVAENGYSDKSSYFGSGVMPSGNSNSLAIDSALYVGYDDTVIKYLSGLKEEFDAQFPDTDMKLVKLFTNKELDNIYALDKSRGILYVLTKEGKYVGQVSSPSLKRAQDFVVYDGSIYLLDRTKIMRIEL